MGIDFTAMPDEEIIGLVQQGIGPGSNTAAILEMQRRATAVQVEGMRIQRESIEVSHRLVDAIQNSGDCASTQTAEVIKLTNTLKVLTWVLVGVGFIQIVLMLWRG